MATCARASLGARDVAVTSDVGDRERAVVDLHAGPHTEAFDEEIWTCTRYDHGPRLEGSAAVAAGLGANAAGLCPSVDFRPMTNLAESSLCDFDLARSMPIRDASCWRIDHVRSRVSDTN